MADIGLGNDANAQAAIDNLIADFNDQPGLPEALNKVADQYHDRQRYEQAGQLFQYIADNCPEPEHVILSRGSLIMLDIGLGNDTNAQAALDSLIADFSDHPALPAAISNIEGAYYNKILETKDRPLDKVYYENPVQVWEKAIVGIPDFFYDDPDLYYFIADCYHHLGKYEKAIRHFQKVVEHFPERQEIAVSAQFRIVQEYRTLKNAGLIPESEANLKIEQAYIAVVENYPNCPLAREAALKLGWLNFNRAQWVDAAMYFELALQKYPENQGPREIIYPLGLAYEKMGELDIAAQFYREFIKMAHSSDARVKRVEAKLKDWGK